MRRSPAPSTCNADSLCDNDRGSLLTTSTVGTTPPLGGGVGRDRSDADMDADTDADADEEGETREGVAWERTNN